MGLGKSEGGEGKESMGRVVNGGIEGKEREGNGREEKGKGWKKGEREGSYFAHCEIFIGNLDDKTEGKIILKSIVKLKSPKSLINKTVC